MLSPQSSLINKIWRINQQFNQIETEKNEIGGMLHALPWIFYNLNKKDNSPIVAQVYQKVIPNEPVHPIYILQNKKTWKDEKIHPNALEDMITFGFMGEWH